MGKGGRIKPSNKLLWFDMEMTGLDPQICVPVQVAAAVTDENLNIIDEMEMTIWQPQSALDVMSPFVKKMHQTNNLLSKIQRCDSEIAEVELELCRFLTRHFEPGQAILAGNSIYQDRRFLNRYFPGFERLLHYRMVDVSALKELARIWYGDAAKAPKEKAAHTALSDTRGSIQELLYYKEKLFKEVL